MDNVRRIDPHQPADDDALNRTPPQDLPAERSVLGAALYSRTAIDAAAGTLHPGDFYRPAHETIWRTILDLHSHGEPVDPITLAAELTKRGDLARVGGRDYLHGLAQDVPSVANVDHYAELVAEAARLRRVVELGTRIAAQGYSGQHTAEEILADARADLTHTATAPTAHARLVDGASFILDLPDAIPAVWGEGQEVLWAEGEALLIAGPAGVGKTTLAQQVVLAAIGLRPHVLGYAVRPVKRFLYLASDRPAQAARSLARMVTETDRPVLAEQLVVWKGPPPTDFIKDPGVLVRLAKQAGADAVCLDSLKDQARELASEEGGQAINQAIQRTLVEGIEVLGLHHHRKQGGGKEGGKEPTSLDDLYGSTWITAGAGSVISLWGAAGDPIVSMRHLKQPAAEVGPVRLKHDHPAGYTEIWHEVDVLDVLLHAKGALTPRELAAQVYSPEKGKPSPSEVEKARRKLDQLVEKRLAYKVQNGGGRGNEAGYVAAFSQDGELPS